MRPDTVAGPPPPWRAIGINRPEARLGPLAPAAGLVALAALVLWPLVVHPTWVAFPPRAAYTDLLIAHLPNAAYLRQTLATYGQWPLWNAQILAGQPFAADPLAGMWYPPNLLLLLPLPLPLLFNLLLLMHLAWAGYGTFQVLRAEGLGNGPAVLGSVAFAATPKLAAHIGAGHVSLVFALAWTPWLLLAARMAAARSSARNGAVAGAVLALVFLADVRWMPYAAALAAGYGIWVRARPHPSRAAVGDSRSSAVSEAVTRRDRSVWKEPGAAILAALVVFGLLVAVLAVPLAEFVQSSNRAALTLEEAGAVSLPALYLVGMVIPDLGGFHEWMTYLGVIPLLLAPLGVRRGTWPWAVAAILAAALALGTNFVLYPLLYRWVPGIDFLRVPARAWFIVALAASAVAAHGAQRLVSDLLPYLARRYDARWLAAPRLALAALVVLTALDLLRVDSTLLEARPMPRLAPAAEWLVQQPGLFRVYSPSYSLPAGDGLQHADGVSPLQLAAAARFINSAAGVPATGYSVTVPPMAGDPATANAGAIPDAAHLGLLNVRYVASEFPLEAPGLVEAQRFGQTYVYSNAEVGPRAWLEGAAGAGNAEVLLWSPNRIEVGAVGPGRLVLSEVQYPGWQAAVDGAAAPIGTAEGFLRAVDLGPGIHAVAFEFRPARVYFGAGLSLVGLMTLAAFWMPAASSWIRAAADRMISSRGPWGEAEAEH